MMMFDFPWWMATLATVRDHWVDGLALLVLIGVMWHMANKERR